MLNSYVFVDGSRIFAGSDLDCYQLLYFIIGDPTAELLSSYNTEFLHRLSEVHKNANRVQIIETIPEGAFDITYLRALTLKTEHDQYDPNQYSFIRQ
jgi:hypothetical protein